MRQVDWLVHSHWYSMGKFTTETLSLHHAGRTPVDCCTPGLAVHLVVPWWRRHPPDWTEMVTALPSFQSISFPSVRPLSKLGIIHWRNIFLLLTLSFFHLHYIAFNLILFFTWRCQLEEDDYFISFSINFCAVPLRFYLHFT